MIADVYPIIDHFQPPPSISNPPQNKQRQFNLFILSHTTMKLLLPALLISQAAAFTPMHSAPIFSSLFAGDYEPMEGEAKINLKIDLDSPKVATMDELEAGSKKVYCRCWMSGTFPLCDGSHVKHNKACGDNVGPLIVSVPKEEKES